MHILTAALIAVLVSLHYLLWLDEDGVRQTQVLRITIRAQTEENAELAERNKGLEAEVKDLKNGLMAIEERARSEMGMTRSDETFYRLLEQPLPTPAIPDKATPSNSKTGGTTRKSRTATPKSPLTSAQPAAAKPAAQKPSPAPKPPSNRHE